MHTILLIEDHAPLRQNLEEMLRLEGFRVHTAADGHEGLRKARSERPDLVLCDIMMPGLDGHAVLAQLRADPSIAATPFIFLTARGEAPDVRAGMNRGADDYLSKPVAMSDLLTAIRTRLDLAAKRRTFAPCFDSHEPLVRIGLSPREAEVLLWIAQGKANAEIGAILGCSTATVKKHCIHVFEKLGVENRAAAMVRALEILAATPDPPGRR